MINDQLEHEHKEAFESYSQVIDRLKKEREIGLRKMEAVKKELELIECHISKQEKEVYTLIRLRR